MDKLLKSNMLRRLQASCRPGLWLAVTGILCFWSCHTVPATMRWPDPPEPPQAPRVRVLLYDGEAWPSAWIEAPYRLRVEGVEDHMIVPQGRARLLAAEGGYRLGDVEIHAPELDLLAVQGASFSLEGRTYRGDLRVRRGSGGFRLINELPLEEYLAGVVGAEMPLAWPDDALKAQVVAARTYAYVNQRGKEDAEYHLMADVRSQVYRGLQGETDRARAVVSATRGVILVYPGGYFATYFHSTCGGGTAPAGDIFGGTTLPPLEGVECGYCDDSPHHSWQGVVLSPSGLAESLRAQGWDVQDIRGLSPVNPDRAGHSGNYRVLTAAGERIIPASALRKASGGKLKSTAFTVELQNGKLICQGHGWGHGTGMCQYGARGMAVAGNDWVQILLHYYPGSRVIRMW